MHHSQEKIRSIAIHLPQFHEIPENNMWWGKRFTEWSNTRKAKPLFLGHHQPHTPFNDNYYDLSKIENLRWQKNLAKSYGIYGFCFYHYWFNGKLMLEKPLELILKDNTWNFPFCLCWANENWTRTWDGLEQNVLMKQEYSIEDDKKHFTYFKKYFENENYIKVDGRPVLIIYRSELFPNIQKTANLWREMALKEGYNGLYLIRVEAFVKNIEPESHGFDASLDFQPDWSQLPQKLKEPFLSRIQRWMKFRSGSPFVENRIYSYNQYVIGQIRNKAGFTEYKKYPCVVPSWDNSPRRKENAIIFKGSNPKTYKLWFENVLTSFRPYSKDENFIFINAWNEWAEGNHLEPCKRWDFQYLEATRDVLGLNNYEDDH